MKNTHKKQGVERLYYGARVQYRSNMTVKAQFNLGIEPTTIACIALVTPDYGPGSATGSYLLAFNRTWFFLARDDVYRADWHWSTQGRFDPAEDIIMQLDLIDITDGAGQRTASRLECRWWVAGQAMPVQPQIVGVDSVYDVSAVMLGAFTNSVEGSRANPVVFRWIEVIGSEIEVEPIVDFNGDFLDDFSDGDTQDGSPVTWWWDASMGECVVTPEGLRMTAPTGWGESLYVFAQDAYGSDVRYTGNVTVRARVKVPESTEGFGSQAFVCLRTGDAAGGGYMLGINRLYFHIQRLDGYHYSNWYSPSQWDSAMNGRFDPAQDVMIQFDVIDLTDAAGHRTTSRLEGRWWLPGQEMPAQPQVSATDAKFDAGGIAIGSSCIDGLNSGVIFRWVEVIGSEVEVEPIVDFNGDGTVDMKDLLKMINNWNQDEPSVDINGDGTVDENDLEILMEYWDQNVDDPTLLAHWALDETEGAVAYDSAGTNNAVLSGNPTWQPTMGQLNGALDLDGIDDCIITGPVLNPAEGPFSVLAWVKGGAAGQVVVSELNSNWLCTNPSNGELTTELTCQGRSTIPLLSQTVITDGEWHRVGLVWGGSNRTLYVDDVIVAQDTQGSLQESNSGLYIATGKAMEAGTFWSGLIDDVRIYTRAVKP